MSEEDSAGTLQEKRNYRAAQKYTYDARGRITGINDGNQNRTGYHTDSWGRVQQIDTAEGGEEKYICHYAGHVTSTTQVKSALHMMTLLHCPTQK